MAYKRAQCRVRLGMAMSAVCHWSVSTNPDAQGLVKMLSARSPSLTLAEDSTQIDMMQQENSSSKITAVQYVQVLPRYCWFCQVNEADTATPIRHNNSLELGEVCAADDIGRVQAGQQPQLEPSWLLQERELPRESTSREGA